MLLSFRIHIFFSRWKNKHRRVISGKEITMSENKSTKEKICLEGSYKPTTISLWATMFLCVSELS